MKCKRCPPNKANYTHDVCDRCREPVCYWCSDFSQGKDLCFVCATKKETKTALLLSLEALVDELGHTADLNDRDSEADYLNEGCKALIAGIATGQRIVKMKLELLLKKAAEEKR